MKSPNCPHQKAEQQDVNNARRTFVAATVPLLFGLGVRANAADAAACFDPESLPSSQKRLRRSLGFRLADVDGQKRCGSCVFFTVSSGECGTCTMLSGGVTATAYVCESWAARS